MKCNEPKPDSSYQACDLELKHSGDHGYLNLRWPRPVPAEPNWDVHGLLEDATPANAWGVEERSFPIIVTETVTRVIRVDAEDEDQALAYWGEGGDFPSLENAEVLDGHLEFERPDKYQRKDALASAGHGRKTGPLVRCPDCGRESFTRSWMHDPYRKCHGPIQWRMGGHGKPLREYQQTPAYDAARKPAEVAA